MKIVEWSESWHDRVLRFRTRVFPDNPLAGDDAHFRWRFLESPGGAPPLTMLAVEGEEILGQWAGIGGRVWAAGRAWPVTWMVDLVVAPEHRDTMAAMALFRAAVHSGRTLLATGVPADLLPFYEVYRWRRIPVGGSYYAVVRPGPLLRVAEPGPSAVPTGQLPPSWAAPLLPLADRLGPPIRRARTLLGGRDPVVLLERVPDTVDALWSRLRDQLAPSPLLSAGALRWKLEGRPCGRHELLGLPGPDGQLRGLAVLKLRARRDAARWGELAAVLVDSDDGRGFDLLLAAAERRALALNLDFLRLRCSLPWQQRRLRSPAWLRRDRPPIDDLFVFDKDQDTADALAGPAWHLPGLAADIVDTGRDEWC